MWCGLHALSYFISTTILWGKYYYCPHPQMERVRLGEFATCPWSCRIKMQAHAIWSHTYTLITKQHPLIHLSDSSVPPALLPGPGTWPEHNSQTFLPWGQCFIHDQLSITMFSRDHSSLWAGTACTPAFESLPSPLKAWSHVWSSLQFQDPTSLAQSSTDPGTILDLKMQP